MTRLLIVLFLVVAFVPAIAQPVVKPERRVAFVVGIGAYQHAPRLANPVNDARAVGDALRRVGFEVDEVYDPDIGQLTRALREFGAKAQMSDVVVVYYSGYGMQVARDNYLLPADARLERDRDLFYEAMPLRLFLGEVAQARKAGIVLLDACRDNPFVDRLIHSRPAISQGVAARGLARVDPVPRNTLIAMATKADQTAEDGDGGRSPFTQVLLENLDKPGVELGAFVRDVREAVLRQTRNRQEPYISGSVGAEPIYLHPRPPNRPPIVEARHRLRIYTGALGISPPTDPDGDKLSVRVESVPRGFLRIGGNTISPGDRLEPEQLSALTYVPELGFKGPAGSFRYVVTDGRGGRADGILDIDVMELTEAAAQMAEAALWDRLLATGRLEDVETFLRIYPNSYLAAAAAHRRDELAARGTLPAEPSTVVPRTSDQPSAVSPAARGRVDPFQSATSERAAPPRGNDLAMLGPPAAVRPAPSGDRVFQDCPDCVKMVRVPAGAFMMGQGSKDPSALPMHKVVLRAFAVSEYPVTIAEWQACHADNVCGPLPRMAATGDDIPIHNVSWDDAQLFVTWISRRSGHAYRLPSEAEWEYAARADTTSRYYWGDNPGVALADCAACGGPRDPKGPLPVNAFPANPFGLYGMSGGVAQWVDDCWSPNYGNASADGSPRRSPSCVKHILRGGSFRGQADDIMPTTRGNYDGPVRYLENGFRVARDLD